MKTVHIILLGLILGLIPTLAFSATYEVTVDESGFTPSNLNILKGDTVTWVNKGSLPHRVVTLSFFIVGKHVYIDSGLLSPGSMFSHTCALPGVVYYYDATNSSHAGIITAEGVAISPASSFLLRNQSMNLVILPKVIQDGNKMRITLDGKVVYDSSEFLTMPKTFTQESEIGVTEEPKSLYIKIPIALNKYEPGTHVLMVEIYSPSGRILSDSAIYELVPPQSYLYD